MTVNTLNITSGPYAGNDVADEFSYTFRVETKEQLSVFETDDNGVQTKLTVDTDFTVNDIGEDAGGTITRLAGPLPTGYSWYIRSNYIATQLTAFASQGGFFPEVHEAAMDKLTFLIQQLVEVSNRSIRVSGSNAVPEINPTESTVIGFDSNRDLTVLGFGEIGVDGVVPITQPVQLGDGVNQEFATPATGAQLPQSFFVHVNGSYMRPVTEFTYDSSTGNITFVETPPLGAQVEITYFNPAVIGNAPTVAENVTDLTAGQSVQASLNEARPLANIAALKALTGGSVGDVRQTNGYTTAGDGGGDKYKAVAKGGVPDDATLLEGQGVDWELVTTNVNVATTTELEDVAHTVNVFGKAAGAQVFNTTTNKPVWASGPLPADAWLDAQAVTQHSPV